MEDENFVCWYEIVGDCFLTCPHCEKFKDCKIVKAMSSYPLPKGYYENIPKDMPF